jgi:hypothetical protein
MARRGICLLGIALVLCSCGAPSPARVAPASDTDKLHPPAQGPVVTLGRGTVEGRRWRLTGYRSADGLCVDLHMGPNYGGGCGRPSKGHLSVGGIGWTQELPDLAQVDGEVSEEVTRLELRSRGRTRDIELFEGFGRTFFVAFVPTNERSVLTAYDREGKVLGRQALTRAELDPDSEP